jgi:hypothetical protein
MRDDLFVLWNIIHELHGSSIGTPEVREGADIDPASTDSHSGGTVLKNLLTLANY